MRYIKFFIPFVATALMLSACTITNKTPKKMVPLSPSFSKSGAVWQKSLWWQEFKDRKLNQFMYIALTQNYDLTAAWSRIIQASTLVRQSNAALYPALAINSNVKRTLSHQSSSQNSSLYDASLSASYELDLWDKVKNSSKARQHEYLASREAYEATALSLSAQIASIWFQLAEKERLRQVLNRQLANNKKTLELISIKAEVGQMPVDNVLQQRQQIEATRGELQLLKGSKKVLQNALKILSGQAPTTKTSQLKPKFVKLKSLPRTGLPSQLLLRRPDLKQLWQQLKSAEKSVLVAKANRLPSFNLTASTGSSALAMNTIFENWASSLLGSITQSLFNAGKLKAEVARTRAVVQEKLSLYAQGALQALGEVEDALAQESAQKKYIASIVKQISDSKKSREQIQEHFIAGENSYLDILTSQTTLDNLEKSKVAAQRQLIDYRINLYKALAGGFLLKKIN